MADIVSMLIWSNWCIEACTDSNWAESIVDRKSTSGYCTFVWGNLVTWRSKGLLPRVVQYVAMSLGIYEEIWLQKMLSDLHQDYEVPMKLFCDNKTAINIPNNSVQHDRTKHVKIDRHFIKEKLDSGSLWIPYILQANKLLIFSQKSYSDKASSLVLSCSVLLYVESPRVC